MCCLYVNMITCCALPSKCPQNKERKLWPWTAGGLSSRDAAATDVSEPEPDVDRWLTVWLSAPSAAPQQGHIARRCLFFNRITISTVPGGSYLFGLVYQTKTWTYVDWCFSIIGFICAFLGVTHLHWKRKRKCDLETGSICSKASWPLMRPSNKCLTYTVKGSGFNLLVCPLARTKSMRTWTRCELLKSISARSLCQSSHRADFPPQSSMRDTSALRVLAAETKAAAKRGKPLKKV